jgi:dinuclear metal center YbgI/SA1388 family protein
VPVQPLIVVGRERALKYFVNYFLLVYTFFMDILQLSHYLDNLLDIKEIKDSSNAMNGLQVQNTGDIKKVGLAVDLCMATIEKAVAAECNMMFVHHGMLWGGVKPIRGNFYDKVSTMMRENLGLYSAHLPLDMHPVLGNNKALADQLELSELEPFGEYGGQKIGFKGRLKTLSAEELGEKLEDKLGSPVKVIGSGEVQTIGVVSGGAADILSQAAVAGLDAYLTGEGCNHHYHEAIENECVLILAGHYATETGGVKAVGKHLAEQFGIKTEFIDYPTGI